MRIKNLGKAHIDVKKGFWYIPEFMVYFQHNPRLIDTRKDVKQLKASYAKRIQVNTPALRKPQKRADYDLACKSYRKELHALMIAVYDEMRKDSFQFPLLLQKCKDYDHPRQWLHCLYKGNIYQFDKHGYTSDAMVEGINRLEAPLVPAEPPAPEIPSE